MKLSELRERRPEEKTITLRGKCVPIRFLTASETMVMETVLPRPNIGEMASQQSHPRNLAAMNKFESRLGALIAGAALRIEHADSQQWGTDKDPAWCTAYADMVLDELSAEEIKSVIIIMRGWLMDLASDVRLIGDEKQPGN